MKLNKLIYAAVTVFVVFITLSSFLSEPQDQKQEKKAWEIPEKYQKMENPFADDESIVKYGKSNYMRHCRACHGNEGKGDGPKARNLKAFPGDFTSEEFQKESDGTIYYQSIIGRDEMPNFESKIPEEEDRWAVVMYIRSMKAKAKE